MRAISILALVLLCVLAVLYADHVPAPAPGNAPPQEFSAERAMGHVRQIAREPHPTGTDAHAEVRGYIVAQARALGLQVALQQGTGVGTRYPVAGRIHNIVARVPGTRPAARAVLLMAHYDGVPAGPAAGDDASGSAVLLETLRAIRAGQPLQNDVIALFTDSEEAGLLGAAAFVREHAWAKDVAVVLNFEARGTHGPSLMFETGAGNRDVVSVLRRVGGGRATSLSTAVYRQLPNDTDLSELALLQQPAMNFGFIGGVERYHTSEDDVAHLSAGSVQHHGNQALALTRAFGNGPLPRPASGDAVFFDLPFIGIVIYSYGFAAILGVVTLLLAIVAAVLLRRSQSAVFRDVALGAIALVLSLIVAALLAAGVISLLGRMHAGMPWGGAPQRSGAYAVAIGLLSVAVVSALFQLGRRVASARGLTLGALIVMAGLALSGSIMLPGISFLLVWPVLLALAALVLALAGRRPVVRLVSGWIAAVVTIFLFIPTTYLMVLVALGLDLVGAVVLATFAALGAWLVMPQLEPGDGRRWTPPLAAGATALLCVLVGATTVRTDADNPVGSVFVYAIDADNDATAWLAGAANAPGARRWVQASLAALAGTAREGGPTREPPGWLARSYDRRGIVAAPRATVPAPRATIVSDSTTATGRIVTLLVRAGAGARAIGLAADSGVVLSAAVDGRSIDPSRYRSRPRRWSLEYVAPSDSGIVLRLVLRPNSAASITATARHLGIPPLPGIQLPTRPTGVLPIQSGDITLVHAQFAIPAN